MDVALRAVDDEFLREVIFPALTLDAEGALAVFRSLHSVIADDETRGFLEVAVERMPAGAKLAHVKSPYWETALSRLMFSRWKKQSWGWTIFDPHPAYGASWETAVTLALMLEDVDFPYAEPKKAVSYREKLWNSRPQRGGIATMMCGFWDHVPKFNPAGVLTPPDLAAYLPDEKLVRAGWSWRSTFSVSQVFSRLPGALKRILLRESDRLGLKLGSEHQEVLAYWLGSTNIAPVLNTSFAGLGLPGVDLVGEMGSLVALIRKAAYDGLGLTAVFTAEARGRTADYELR